MEGHSRTTSSKTQKHRKEQPVPIEFGEREEEGRAWRGRQGWDWGGSYCWRSQGLCPSIEGSSDLSYHRERDGMDCVVQTGYAGGSCGMSGQSTVRDTSWRRRGPRRATKDLVDVGNVASDCHSHVTKQPGTWSALFSDMVVMQQTDGGVQVPTRACRGAGGRTLVLSSFCVPALCQIVGITSFSRQDNPVRYCSHFTDRETDREVK